MWLHPRIIDRGLLQQIRRSCRPNVKIALCPPSSTPSKSSAKCTSSSKTLPTTAWTWKSPRPPRAAARPWSASRCATCSPAPSSTRPSRPATSSRSPTSKPSKPPTSTPTAKAPTSSTRKPSTPSASKRQARRRTRVPSRRRNRQARQVQRQPHRPAIAREGRTRCRLHRARRPRRHRQRRRHQACTAGNRPRDSRSLLHQRGRKGQGLHRDPRVRRESVIGPQLAPHATLARRNTCKALRPNSLP